jgi:hypothetical protein
LEFLVAVALLVDFIFTFTRSRGSVVFVGDFESYNLTLFAQFTDDAASFDLSRNNNHGIDSNAALSALGGFETNDKLTRDRFRR